MKKWETPMLSELTIAETAQNGKDWSKPDKNYVEHNMAYTTYDPVKSSGNK